MTQAVALAQQASTGVSQGFKNRIINGAMVIDQRNAGASMTSATNGSYSLDRWGVQNNSGASRFTLQQDAGAVTPPAGFVDYLGITSTSAYSLASGDACGIYQNIEGFNTAGLNWGTANAQAVTLSFWVRSSLTGTFGGALLNGAGNRSYVFSYTISSANTWEQKSVTIAGDTSGTWGSTNGTGIQLAIGIGTGTTYSGTAGAWSGTFFLNVTGNTSVVGTSGATFYITGVQLEVGSTATSFDYRPYGTELALCQRYYYQAIPTNSNGRYTVACVASSATTAKGFFTLPVTMRTQPTLSASSGTNYYDFFIAGTDYQTNALSIEPPTTNYAQIGATIAGATAGQAGVLYINNSSAAIAFSAEL